MTTREAPRAEPAPPRRAAGAAEPSELLRWGSTREVLARIVPEDPLALRGLVAARLAERALLCDCERVLLVAQVQCALHASRWRGEPEIDAWLAQRVEEAFAIVLAEDGAAEGRGEPLRAFAEPLSLDSDQLAVACARFNRLPFEEREAFFALVLDSVVADRLARARGLSLPELARRARAGLQSFLLVAPSAPGGARPG